MKIIFSCCPFSLCNIKHMKEWLLLLIFLSMATAMRFFSFFPSELDHDESTYIIIGNELAKGKILYSEVTDTKPIAIFLVYAVLQKLVGYSIFWKRFFVALVVGFTGFLVQRVSLRLFNDFKSSFAAGVIYLFYTSTWGIFGLSPNTELYFNLFTIAALLFFIKGGTRSFVAGGLLEGIGFMFKYLPLLDYVAFMGCFFVRDFRRTKSQKGSVIFPYLFSGIAFLLPFALTALYFYKIGHFNDFYFVTFKLPRLYGYSSPEIRYLRLLGDALIRFFPITFFFFYVLLGKHRLLNGELKIFFIVWLLSDLIAMYLPKKGSSHYAIQIMLPISLVAGQFFNPKVELKKMLNFLFRGKTSIAVLITLLLCTQLFAYKEYIKSPDRFIEIANYLKKNLDDGEKVFVSNYEPIIYYLLKEDPPTKYVHSSLLFSDLHKAFQLDNVAEVKRILDTHPKFVLIQRKNEMVERLMGNKYQFVRNFRSDNVSVYRLKKTLTNFK